MIKLARPDLDHPGSGRRRGGRGGLRNATVTVEVTERALGALVELRSAEYAMPGQALGLVLGPNGSVGLVLDLPGSHDRVFSRDDTPIFFIDAELGPRLAGRILDRCGEPGEERFTLDRRRQDEPPPASGPRRL